MKKKNENLTANERVMWAVQGGGVDGTWKPTGVPFCSVAVHFLLFLLSIRVPLGMSGGCTVNRVQPAVLVAHRTCLSMGMECRSTSISVPRSILFFLQKKKKKCNAYSTTAVLDVVDVM